MPLMRMTRSIRLLALTPILLGASGAYAAGINLGWNDCPGGATYSVLETFACDTNAGVHTLVGSFISPVDVEAMTANEIVIDVQTSGSTLAPWWTFGTGQCRAMQSLSPNYDFLAGPFTCHDYWQGGALGGLSWNTLSGFTNACRIKGVHALPTGDPRIGSIPNFLEIYSFKININNARTAGPGACSGCSDGACVAFIELRINQPLPLPTIYIQYPAVSNFVIWQGWNPAVKTCPGTPTRQKTWGSIKAIYR